MDEQFAAKATALANKHQLHGSIALDILLEKITLSEAIARPECQRRGREIAAWPTSIGPMSTRR